MILAVGMVLGTACGAMGQPNTAKRPMTFQDLMAVKRVSDPQVSPSGKWVLFSVTEVSLEKNTKVNHLWVVALDGSAKERQATSGGGESGGRFSPDGKAVMYSADGQIAVAAWDDAAGTMGAGRAVTSLETEADGAIWAPDSKHFLFVSSVYPECEAAGAGRNEAQAKCNAEKDAAAAKSPVKAQVWDHLLYRHWDHYVGAKHSHVFYGSVEGGVPEDLTPASVVGDHEAPTFSLGGPLGYAISPDGKEMAYVVNLDKVPAESTNNDVFVLQVGAEPGTAKKVSTSPGSDDGPAYSPDGKWLAWRSQARGGFESDKFDLVVMDRATGKIRDLTEKFDGWVDEFAWGPKSDTVFFVSGMTGEEAIFQTSGITGALAHEIAGIAKDGEFGSIGITPDDQTFVAIGMKVEHPSTVVAMSVHVPDETLRVLTHVNDALVSRLSLSPLEPFWFAGAGGTKVQGFIVKPPNFDPAKKYPVKFLMHGGPQTAWGDAWSYRWNAELFAADGYVVVMINRRGSTGYGQKFVDEVSGDWGGLAYVDLMKGLDYAEATYPFLDKNRECALGASYGGFMADWVLTHTDRFKCIVTHDGMYNPQSAFGTTEELWFNEWEFRPLAGSGPDAVVEQTKPAHPWDFYDKPASEDPFRKWSPMMFIKNAVTPTLVIHSQRDYRLDVSEGLQLFTALQLRGVPSRMLYFPDEGHWVLKPQNSELWYQTVNDWCDRWTGMGKYAAAGPEKNPMMEKQARP
jgi:dipeptidyl aminopeptidase/acylaminoacyl peptidase